MGTVDPRHGSDGRLETLLSMLEASGEPTFAVDRELRYTAYNRAHASVMQALYGARIELGGSMAGYMSLEADREVATSNLRRCLAGERIVVESGSGPEPVRRVFEIVHQPLIEADGSVGGVAVFARDLTELRRAEALVRMRLELSDYAATHSLDELLQEVLEKAEASTASSIGFFHFVNDDQQGLELQSWSRRTIGHFCKAAPAKAHYAIEHAGVWADAVRFARPVVHDDYANLPERKGLPDGHAAIVRELVVPIVKSGRVVGVLGVGNKAQHYTEADVAAASYLADLVWELVDRTRARDALRESEARLQAVFQSSLDALVVLSPEGVVESVNAAAQALLGVRVGDPRERLFDPAEPAAASWLAELDRVGAASRELDLRRADGSHVVAIVAGARCETASGPRTSLVLHDLKERRLLEVQLAHARKLEAVGQLAAGIAHEINSPTQYVIDSLRFAREASETWGRVAPRLRALALEGRDEASRAALEAKLAALEEEEDLAYLDAHVAPAFERCADGLARVSRIVRSMKDFAHPDREEQSAADLERGLESTITIAKNEYKYVADLETAFCGLPLVTCHLGDLNQVFLNLLVNAAHAIEEVVAGSERRGVIRVATRQDGAFAEVSVTDSGAGIPPHVAERIFEPFFTTKAVGKGTGQGLAIARAIVVEKHGGTLRFEAAPGGGTTFFVRVPIAGRQDRR